MKLGTPIVALGELLWDMLPSGRRAGGAPFNFAFHCHQLGHPAIIVSRVGDDDLGRELREEVKRLGMSDEFIQTDREHPTGTVSVQLDADGKPTFTITEDVAWDYIQWRGKLQELTQDCKAFCYGTLAQRNWKTHSTFSRLFSLTTKRALCLCDINLRPPFYTKHIVSMSALQAHWLKLNEDEVPIVKNAIIPGMGRTFKLENIKSFKLLCVTRGANGCRILAGDEVVDLPGIPIEVADTVGAGDAFTAALLTQRIEGKPLAEAARFANAYAAVVASKPGGTPTVKREDVERLL